MWQNFFQLPTNGKIRFGTSYWSIIPSLVEIGAFLEFGQCGETFASEPKNGKIGLGTCYWSIIPSLVEIGAFLEFWAMWQNFCQLPKMAESDYGTSYWCSIPSLVEIGALLEFGQTFASCPKWPNRTRHILLVHYTKFGWNRSTFRIWAMWQNFCQLPKMAKSDSAHPTGPLYQVWLKSEHF